MIYLSSWGEVIYLIKTLIDNYQKQTQVKLQTFQTLRQYILIPFSIQKIKTHPYSALPHRKPTSNTLHPMNKENRHPKVKCSYCTNEAAGIIYRPSNDLDNALACAIHATNLFIPFKDSTYDQKLLSESRYRSPMKGMQFSQISQIAPVQDNPETFFDKLMENIIAEFNTMKKQLMTNYNAMKNLKKSPQALKFRMQGNNSFPYMLINNDQQMMMNHFIQRIQHKHNEQVQKKKRQQMAKRRMQISTILSSTNLPHSKFVDIKEVNSLFLSRSVQGSPEKFVNDTSIEKSSQGTDRKPVVYRDYSRTERRQKE